MRAARAGAAWASMSTSRVWISAMRMGSRASSASSMQRGALDVGLQHEIDQRLRPARRLLLDAADPRACAAIEIAPPSGEISPGISRNSVVLPAPLRPTSPTRAPVGSADGRAVDQQPLAEAIGEVVDMQHGGLLAAAAGVRFQAASASPPGAAAGQLAAAQAAAARARRRRTSRRRCFRKAAPLYMRRFFDDPLMNGAASAPPELLPVFISRSLRPNRRRHLARRGRTTWSSSSRRSSPSSRSCISVLCGRSSAAPRSSAR